MQNRTIQGSHSSLGFTSLQNEVSLDCVPITGKVPEWLSGTLIRNGPGKFEAENQRLNHWFDGFAMLHKFSFMNGKVSYANRFLKTKAFAKAKENGKIAFREFATDPCRSLFRRLTSMFSDQATDNTNVNVTRIANEYIAMTETPIPVQFNPRTLDTLGVVDYGDQISGNLTTAHPHYDFSRQETISYMTQLSRESVYNVYRIIEATRTRELLASIKVKEPSYMHSFGLTEHYVILVEFPLVVNPLGVLLSGRPFAENLQWRQEKPARFSIVSRKDGKMIGSYEAEPFFGFHHVNAFEQEGDIVVDIIAYSDASIVRSFYLNVLRGEGNENIPSSDLRRYYISLNNGHVEFERLYEDKLELPRINYKEYSMNDYSFMYASGINSVSDFSNRLVKVNVKNGGYQVWAENNAHPGEPVFVSRPGSIEEDDGVVLSVVLDSEKGNSFLLILDAESFEELARAVVPHHIPFGFHGEYFSHIN